MNLLFKKDLYLAPDNEKELEQTATSYVNISSNSIEIARVSTERKVLSLSTFKTPVYTNSGNWSKYLEELLLDESFLKLLTKNVQYSIVVPNTSLVPLPLFDENKLNSLPTPNGTNAGDWMHQSLADNEITGVYKMPVSLSNFQSTQPLNSFVSWLNALEITDAPKAHICLLNSEFTLTLTNNGSIDFNNTFSFSKPDDILFYLLSTLETRNILHSKLSLTLWGEIDKGGTIHHLLSQYISDITFGKRPKTLKYSYSLDKLEAHRFPFLFWTICE